MLGDRVPLDSKIPLLRIVSLLHGDLPDWSFFATRLLEVNGRSATFRDPLGEHRRQASGDDFPLSLGDVILDAAEHD